MQVSVTIIARDAAKHLSDCLAAAHKLSDDIVVVVDDRTTDTTSKIASNYSAKVYHRTFINFSDQHSFADKQTMHAWVLSLDADETLSDQLISEIHALPDQPAYTAFWVPRKNIIFGKQINHSNWDPNGITRLYVKTKSRWSGEIHEQVRTSGLIGKLSGTIRHQNYRSVSEFLSRQNIYSSARAAELFNHRVRFSLVRLVTDPFFDFCRRFIWHAGFLDNWHGLFLSYLMSIYHLSVWVKLWQKENYHSR